MVETRIKTLLDEKKMERMEHRREISELHKHKLSSTLSAVLNTALKLVKRSTDILRVPWKVSIHYNALLKNF